MMMFDPLENRRSRLAFNFFQKAIDTVTSFHPGARVADELFGEQFRAITPGLESRAEREARRRRQRRENQVEAAERAATRDERESRVNTRRRSGSGRRSTILGGGLIEGGEVNRPGLL